MKDASAKDNPKPAFLSPMTWYHVCRAEGIPKRKSIIGGFLLWLMAPKIVTVERKMEITEEVDRV